MTVSGEVVYVWLKTVAQLLLNTCRVATGAFTPPTLMDWFPGTKPIALQLYCGTCTVQLSMHKTFDENTGSAVTAAVFVATRLLTVLVGHVKPRSVTVGFRVVTFSGTEEQVPILPNRFALISNTSLYDPAVKLPAPTI